MECKIQKTSKKGGYDPKIKAEEYEEWLKTVCKKIANGNDYLVKILLDDKGSRK